MYRFTEHVLTHDHYTAKPTLLGNFRGAAEKPVQLKSKKWLDISFATRIPTVLML